MLNRSASLAMSTSVLKALPGKLDIKRHSPSILYLSPIKMIAKLENTLSTTLQCKDQTQSPPQHTMRATLNNESSTTDPPNN